MIAVIRPDALHGDRVDDIAVNPSVLEAGWWIVTPADTDVWTGPYPTQEAAQEARDWDGPYPGEHLACITQEARSA